MNDKDLIQRKDEHLNIVLDQRATSSLGNGFEAWQFEHCALPELNLVDIDLSTAFLGRALRAPLLISSMTGGARRAADINRHLAQAAQALGIAMAVGSQRVALETANDHGLTRALRTLAPDIPLLANLGAGQIVAADGLDKARRAVDMLEADALIVHLNPLQEAVQRGGDRDWRGVLDAIAHLVRQVGVPVVVKEVGAGISVSVAQALVQVGVHTVDLAGAGGTSWAAVEAQRASSEHARRVAMSFEGWGIPTAWALQDVRQALPSASLIASGGIREGIEAAKALRLGADLVAQAAAVLGPAVHSETAVVAHFSTLIEQLRIACFCTGSASLAALRNARLFHIGLPRNLAP